MCVEFGQHVHIAGEITKDHVLSSIHSSFTSALTQIYWPSEASCKLFACHGSLHSSFTVGLLEVPFTHWKVCIQAKVAASLWISVADFGTRGKSWLWNWFDRLWYRGRLWYCLMQVMLHLPTGRWLALWFHMFQCKRTTSCHSCLSNVKSIIKSCMCTEDPSNISRPNAFIKKISNFCYFLFKYFIRYFK